MENVIKRIRNAQEQELKSMQDNELINEIRDVRKQMRCIDMWFQMENDYDLIEACIYQKEVLMAKYRYLMKKARMNNITAMQYEPLVQAERG